MTAGTAKGDARVNPFAQLLKWGHSPHYNRGMVHFNRGEWERAAESFETVLTTVRDPNDPDLGLARCYAAEARAHLGLACFHHGDDARAELEFTRALEENPSFPDLRYYRARICERSGRIDEALAELDRALADHPRYVEALLLKAVCLAHRGDEAGSRAALDAAQGLGFELPQALTSATTAEWGASDWKSLLARADGAPAPSGPQERALERYHAGDLEGAIAELARAVEAHPGWADLHCRLGGLLIESGRVAPALEQLDAALRINGKYLEARLLRARLTLEHGDAAEAATHLEAALAAQPDYPDLHFWLGLARFRAGALEAAVSPLEKAVALNRQFARAERLLGLVLHALGRHDDAVRHVRRGLQRDRDVTDAALDAVAVLMRTDPAAAEDEIQRAIAVQADYPDLHLALARARRTAGNLEGAREAYRAALALEPGYAAAQLELAGVELTLGRHAAAEELLVAVTQAHADWPDAQALLGRTRLLRGDPHGAEGPLRAAVARNPGYAAARADLGWALLAQRRPHDADEEFARALELDPLAGLPRQQLEWKELLTSGRGGAA